MSNRVSGIVIFKVDGVQYKLKSQITYNLGLPKREPVVGADEVHGFHETPQVAFIEGEITDQTSLDLKSFIQIDGGTAIAKLANGKTIMVSQAWNATEGTVNTEGAVIPFRFEGKKGEEIK